MLNKSFINKKYPPIIFKIEKNHLIKFAKATGQKNPIYFDEKIAKKNNHPSILAPLTFLTVIAHEHKQLQQYIVDIGIDFSTVLHAGQKYTYHNPIYAGDTITMENQILDIYEKKEGTLIFIDIESTYNNQNNIMVSQSLSTLVSQ
ncbi:MAG: MaoC family dehydratase N-terminal domain-containing protein [Candidatus Neomarinimicrobiota bacterium]